LTLLGHELTHLGQPLAFKHRGADVPVGEDSQELAARTQEERIQQVIEKGWPEPAGREFQHSRKTSPASSFASGISMVQRAVEINELEVGPAQNELAGNGPAAASQPAEAPSGAQETGSGGGQSPAANIENLARQVYTILKDHLRSERDRHHLYR
jgi:hypothetical protein